MRSRRMTETEFRFILKSPKPLKGGLVCRECSGSGSSFSLRRRDGTLIKDCKKCGGSGRI
jgi:DnaJ-class molecular chaperone